MDKVFIEGLEIEALIGIYDWERRIRQPLRFDLEMAFDNRRPAASDAIEDTLDYKAVSKRLIAFVSESGFGLVETLAERCAALVIEEFGVEHVRLKLSKPGAVRGATAVGVIIERTRSAQKAETPEQDRDTAVRDASNVRATAGTADAPEVAAAMSSTVVEAAEPPKKPEPSKQTVQSIEPPAVQPRTFLGPSVTRPVLRPPFGLSFLRTPRPAASSNAPTPTVTTLGAAPVEATEPEATGPTSGADAPTAETSAPATPVPAVDVNQPATDTAPAPEPSASARADFATRVRSAPTAAPPPRPHNPASALGRATRPAYLSLGSNIDAANNLRSALRALRARFGEVIASPVYRIPAVGFEGPDFLNAAAIIDSDLDPFALVAWLQGIENAHGRLRGHVKNSSRTLDMDIVYFDSLVLDLPGRLQLPRPELRHAFVLKPLADIAPGFVDPVRNKTLAELWASHPERDSVFESVRL
jgi:2-amino-4-hydroxy-6-hydroxymethyldihydropteridine diphosphokinase